MIWIGIPLYQYNASALVAKLCQEIETKALPFRLLLSDDASHDTEWLNKWKEHPLVHILWNTQNIGRSGNRNRLLDFVGPTGMLLIDADTLPHSESFLEHYLKALSSKPALCFGGFAYTDEKPEPSLLLRWKFGREREFKRIEKRIANPYADFLVNNLYVDLQQVPSFRFDESVIQYGYEDNLIGAKLEAANIPILHIDNPVIHLGLEPAPAFLKKTQLALETGVTWVKANPKEKNTLLKQVKVLRLAYRLHGIGMSRLVLFFLNLMEKSLKQNLLSTSPSLFCFDLYKLGYSLKLTLKNDQADLT
jgi:hypothetical protein